jgi:transcriptional regulator with XRE-family HTH domain
MSITSLKNRINKRVELEKFKQDFTDIGGFIKKKRKELNVTQDEISKGICSISYLSKIENNQIVPNDFYVKEIMGKLQVNEDVFYKSIKDKEYIQKMIEAYFYMDQDKIESLYEEIKDVEHNIVINLCKLGYHVYFHHEDKNQYVMMLENLVNNMSDLDVKVYLYFAALYFMQNEKFKIALEFVLLSRKLHVSHPLLEGLFYELSYYVKQRLLVKNCASEDYYHAMNIFQKYHNVNRIIYLALKKAQVFAKENPRKALQILRTIKVKELSLDIEDFYYYIKAQVLFQLAMYQEATLELKHISDNSHYYLRKMILLLQICQIEDDKDMIDSIKQIVKEYTPEKCEMRSKIYYHYLIQETIEDQKEYLRNIAIPFSIKVEDYDFLEKYTEEVMEICQETSRYKEALQYYKKYQKELDKVKRILY